MPLQAHIRRALVVTPRAERIIRVSRGSLTVREGETATFDVWLSERPRTGQTVTVQVASTATGEATVNKSSLTFDENDFGTRQTVTVTGVADADARDENASVTLFATGGGYDDSTAIAVVVEDTTQKRLRVSDPSLSFDSTTLSRTIGVRLSSEPVGGDVTVAVSEDSDRFSVDESSLTFTAMNWNAQQIVTVSATAGANATGTLTLDPSGADYGSVASVTVALAFALTLPAVPTGLSLSASYYNANTQQRVRATWNAAARATSYEVRYKKSTETNWTTITGLTSTSYTANGADPNSTYDVQVQSRNASGPSGWSSTVQVTTGRSRGNLYATGFISSSRTPYTIYKMEDGYSTVAEWVNASFGNPVAAPANGRINYGPRNIRFDSGGTLHALVTPNGLGADRYYTRSPSGTWTQRTISFSVANLGAGIWAGFDIDSHGHLIFAYSGNNDVNRVLRSAASVVGGANASLSELFRVNSGVSGILDVAVDSQDNIYFSSFQLPHPKSIGRRSAADSTFSYIDPPTGINLTEIALDHDDNLYAMQNGGARIFKRTGGFSDGTWDAGIASPGASGSIAFD